MGTLGHFAVKMKRRGEDVERNVTLLTQQVAKSVLGTVTRATPVDTGQAVSNWQVKINAAATDVIPAFYPGELRSTASANISAASQAGYAVVSMYNGTGKNIHITNNVPYIGELNDGSSRQAPASFVQLSIVSAISEIRSAKLLGR
jgi:hypothetical protein